MCSPREGHIDAVYHILNYLQKNLGKNPFRMAYDPVYEPTDENVFEFVGRYLDQWKYFYPDAQEMIPRNMPEALGRHVVIKVYVNANHAGNIANMRSNYGTIIFVNNAYIIWYSRHQNTV